MPERAARRSFGGGRGFDRFDRFDGFDGFDGFGVF